MVKPATEFICAGFFMGKFYARLSFEDGDNRDKSLSSLTPWARLLLV